MNRVSSECWYARARVGRLHVSPEHVKRCEQTTLFDIDSHGWHRPVHDIFVERSRLQSVEDSSKWSASDWETLACHGINADGERFATT